MTLYGRFNISEAPGGIAPHDDDPYPCDCCNRRIMPGQPYWGGGVDYFGEGNDVYCARCQAGAERGAERQVREYEREMKAPCAKCGKPNGAHVNPSDQPCELATSFRKSA